MCILADYKITHKAIDDGAIDLPHRRVRYLSTAMNSAGLPFIHCVRWFWLDGELGKSWERRKRRKRRREVGVT